MNRRGFLGSIIAVAPSSLVDPEKLLWVPGAKHISIPKPISLKPWRCPVSYRYWVTVSGKKYAIPAYSSFNSPESPQRER